MLFTLAVPVVMAEASEDVAVWISESVARDPEESDAPVRVRVPKDHTSAAVSDPPPEIVLTAASRFATICLPIEPAVFRLDVATFHTAAGTAANPLEKPAASEVEAAVTTVLVFALMPAASEVEALST